MNVEIEARVYPVHVDLGDRVATVDLFGPLGSRLVAAADARDDARKQEEEFSRQRRSFIERGIDAYVRSDRPTWEQRETYEQVFELDDDALIRKYEAPASYDGRYDDMLGD